MSSWRGKGGKNNYPSSIPLASKLLGTVRKRMKIIVIFVVVVIVGHILSLGLSAQQEPPSLGSLKQVPVPQPANLGVFVKNKKAVIALGKSLFWDMQVGSDGIQSCASCHFHAGTDNRSKNQLHPGPDATVNAGLNYTLKQGNYPFHKLADPDDRSSTVLSDTNDVAGSQGVVLSKFNSVVPGSTEDNVTVQPDAVFNVNGINVRQVTSRNTPSTINAVFNFRNFWDGRAQNVFNGVNPFGLRDPNARVIKAVRPSQLQEVQISLKNSSLASQAVGPPLSIVEASATGRVFPDVGQKFGKIKNKKLPREAGKKLRGLRPLGKQLVASNDSALGALSRWPRPGLKSATYTPMIKAAFKPEWWKSNRLINIDADGNRTFIKKSPEQTEDEDGVIDANQLAAQQFTLLDYNFSLFMGLAIQMYESTLVADNTPLDRYLEGNTNALTNQQKQGLEIFQNKGLCIRCHAGAELTTASVENTQSQRLTRSPAPGNPIQDNGFFNIGVRPTQEDLGVGGSDPFNQPLSEARLAQKGLFNQLLGEDPNLTVSSSDSVAADGAFKTPGLRNVELTAPYFHNGGQLTLEQVVDFYSRGGDGQNLPVINLTEAEKESLVAFLKGLTDERVRKQKAPFDHPQLFIPNGHPGNQTSVTNDGTGKATDNLLEIPPVGRNGGSPLPNFLAANS